MISGHLLAAWVPRGGNYVVFLELRRDSRVTMGISAFPSCKVSSVMSESLGPNEQPPLSMEFSRPEYWNGPIF